MRSTQALAAYCKGDALYRLGRKAEARAMVETADAELAGTQLAPELHKKVRRWLDEPKFRQRS